jgi:hypothetical protein
MGERRWLNLSTRVMVLVDDAKNFTLSRVAESVVMTRREMVDERRAWEE